MDPKNASEARSEPASEAAQSRSEAQSWLRQAQLRRLIAKLTPHRARFAIATLALLVSSGANLLYPQALRRFIDSGMLRGSPERINQIAAAVLAIALVQAGFVWVRHYLMSWLGERVVTDLRKQVFARLLALPPSWFHARRSGEIVGRLASDVTVVEGVIGSELSIALRNAITLAGGLAILIWERPGLTLTMISVVPPLMVGVVVFGKRIRTMSRRVQDRLAHASAHLEEAVGAMQTVQSFVREAHEAGEYGKHVEGSFSEGLHLARWRASFFAFTMLATTGAVVGIVWFGGRDVISGAMSEGDLAAFLLYTTIVAGSVAAIADLWGSLQRASGATERIFEIIDAEAEIEDPEDPVPLPEGRGAVAFEAVDFHYANRADHPVLHAIDLTLAPGEVVALVGPSGSGKTTITALLQRFHDPVKGRITFEGVDLRSLRLSELRRAMAIVAQEPVLFSGSVLDNIGYGRAGASRGQIEAAARDAHAHDFITRFPQGYETVVGERGVQLSGGQRQRIAIARAILADPRVLILDEATSNLDAESEALVQEALQRLMKGRTTLVIAHRLSTVRDADRILVVEGGRIVEQGRHDALLASNGTYKRLVEHQVITSAGRAT